MRFIVFTGILFAATSLLGQRITREQYIEKYKEIAIAKMNEHGIPASITLAQGMLESDNGNSKLVREGNNHFGIKCHNWQGKKCITMTTAKTIVFVSMPPIWSRSKTIQYI